MFLRLCIVVFLPNSQSKADSTAATPRRQLALTSCPFPDTPLVHPNAAGDLPQKPKHNREQLDLPLHFEFSREISYYDALTQK